MPPGANFQVPFFNRDQARFMQGASLALRAIVVAAQDHPLKIHGFTSSGFFSYEFAPLGDESLETFTFPIVDVPIMMSLSTINLDDGINQNGVILQLLCDGNVLTTLASGTVGPASPLTWPVPQPPSIVNQLGDMLGLDFDDGNAGESVMVTVPTNQVWHLKSLFMTYAASAAAANRRAQINIETGGGTAAFLVAPATQQANETIEYHFAPGYLNAELIANTLMTVAMPSGIYMQSGDTISFQGDSMDALDEIENPGANIHKYLLPVDNS